MEKYGYIYLTTNLINNKIYIGRHNKNYFTPLYYGSGKLIKYSLKKYGIENHKVELIVWCKTNEELNNYEKFWIKVYDSINPEIGYNITNGGEGGFTGLNSGNFKKGCIPWIKDKKMSEEFKNKVKYGRKYGKKPDRSSYITSEETKQKIRNTLTGRKLSDEHKENISNGSRGKSRGPMSEENKQKISQSKKGKPNLKISIIRKGKKLSEETKQKMKGRIPWNKGLKYKKK